MQDISYQLHTDIELADRTCITLSWSACLIVPFNWKDLVGCGVTVGINIDDVLMQ